MNVKLLLGDCAAKMKNLPSESIDLVVTSPPYDDMDEDFNPIPQNGMRTYNGYSWDFKEIAQELFRVTKTGGVVVWVVNDPTIDGSESLASSLQKIYFRRVGFKIHDTMIWQKPNYAPLYPNLKRYDANYEYTVVLCKGKIKTFNAIKDHPKKQSSINRSKYKTSYIRKDGSRKRKNHTFNSELFCKRNAVWVIPNGQIRALKHPAPFPEKLAEDHIISWSNPGDVILDPMMGSGTTGKMAIKNGRDFIGIELSKEYFEIAEDRIKKVCLSQEALS